MLDSVKVVVLAAVTVVVYGKKSTAKVKVPAGLSVIVMAFPFANVNAPVSAVPPFASTLNTPMLLICKVPAPTVVEMPGPAVIGPTVYPVPFPMGMSPLGGATDVPVPPFDTGNTPVTALVKFTLPYVGSAPTPPDSNTLPTATSDNFVSDVVEFATSRSPIVYDPFPVPPLAAFKMPDNTTALVVGELGKRPVVPALNEVTKFALLMPMVMLPDPLVITMPVPGVNVVATGGKPVSPIQI